MPSSKYSGKSCDIVAIGGSGAGKSSFLNTMAKKPGLFHSADSGKSVTVKCVKKSSICERTGVQLNLVDTQGTNDTEGRDLAFMRDIQNELRKLTVVNVFVIVISTTQRAMQLEDTLKTFKKLIGPKFGERLMVCFTRADYSGKKNERAERTQKLKENAKALMQKAGITHDVPVVFFDNSVTWKKASDFEKKDNDDSDDDDDENEMLRKRFEKDSAELEKQITLLLDFAMEGEPYQCSAICEDRICSEQDETNAKKHANEVALKLLKDFDDFIAKTRAIKEYDSFRQYGVIVDQQDAYVDQWIEKMGGYGEYVYDMILQFKDQLKAKVTQARDDIFGPDFVQRQYDLLKQVSSNLDAFRACPHCSIVWWNEGGCHQRRCGFHGAPNWNNDIMDVPARGALSKRHGCGRKFEWPLARPVPQEKLKEALRVEKLPSVKEPKTVQKTYVAAIADKAWGKFVGAYTATIGRVLNSLS